MARFPTQSRYPDTELTGYCPIILMPSVMLSSDRYQFGSHRFDLAGIQTRHLPHRKPTFYSLGHRVHVGQGKEIGRRGVRLLYWKIGESEHRGSTP